MQARYGLDRRPVGRWIGISVIVALFVGACAWAGYALTRPTVQTRLITWDDLAPDRVDITFDVRRQAADEVQCVVRAQDINRIDVGYAIVTLPAGTDRVTTTYPLRTIAPAYTAELLGCAAGEPPRVPPPQFPPGVVPPDQPWTPDSATG